MEKNDSKPIPSQNLIRDHLVIPKSELCTSFNKVLKVEIYKGAEARKSVDYDCFVSVTDIYSDFKKYYKTEKHNDVHPKLYEESDCVVSVTEKCNDFHQILKEEIRNDIIDIKLGGEKIKNMAEICKNQKLETKSNFIMCSECIAMNISKDKRKEKMPCSQAKFSSILCTSLEISPNDQDVEVKIVSNLEPRQSNAGVSPIQKIGERLHQPNSSNAACDEILDLALPPKSCDEIRFVKRVSYKDFSKMDKSALNKRQSPANKKHNCDMGSGVFPSKSKRVKQTRILTGEKLYKSASGSNWGQNKKRHTAQRSYKCKICYRVLRGRSNLYKHQKSHTEEKLYKSYKCRICSVAFATSSTLVRHNKLHGGEKPHKCDTCLVAFPYKSDLKRHKCKCKHHSYQCDICSAALASSSALRYHKSKHNLYQCDICFAALTSSSTLNRHSKKHKEKLYQCDICSTVLASSSTLERHKKRHSGDKPYKCDICSVAFATRSTLARHIKRHA